MSARLAGSLRHSLDAIREILVDEQDTQPSRTLSLLVQMFRQQRRLFETRALDTLQGGRKTEQRSPKRQWSWGRPLHPVFETKPLDTLRDSNVQVGHLLWEWVPRRARGSQMSVYQC